MFFQGFEAAVQIDNKIYNLNSNTQLAPESSESILYYTRNYITKQPVLLQASVEQSVSIT